MTKYLLIQLDDTSTSFCHYENPINTRRLIPIDTLKEGIIWGLKENVVFQFLFPDYELPKDYLNVINSVYHSSIVPSLEVCHWLNPKSDVIVISNIKDTNIGDSYKGLMCVVRDTFDSLITNNAKLKELIKTSDKVTIVPTNVAEFSDSFNETYSSFLDSLANCVKEEYRVGHLIQLNVITDRIYLEKMNNCNAGYNSVTLCPDGKFYLCPAFYLDGNEYSIGDLKNGLEIKNNQLYNIDYAPICKICDCWQCKRCIWLNRKLTLEVNTPSHQQCVISHIERNASIRFLSSVRKIGKFMPEKVIPELDYLDPLIKAIK